MPDVDAQIVLQGTTNLSKDRYVNTLHFSSSIASSWQGLVDGIGPDLATLWGATLGNLYPNTVTRTVVVKMYNPDDPEPRRPATFTAAIPGSSTAPGPAEVALCLSYYTDVNTPTTRGRIYIGPLAIALMGDRPGGALQTQLLNLATALSDLGGPDVDWQHRSVKTGERRRVENVWVDNAWDTQRRRGLAPTSRETRAVSG